MNIYILKSYGLYSMSYTGFVKIMGYKYLLLAAHAITALLSCRRGVGWEGVSMNVVIMGPTPMRGGGVKKSREE